MTRTQLILLAAGGSAALLIAAWTFQAIGYAPCKMCLWQRWPHAAAMTAHDTDAESSVLEGGSNYVKAIPCRQGRFQIPDLKA